jgi:iron complex outermembrane receptor protein
MPARRRRGSGSGLSVVVGIASVSAVISLPANAQTATSTSATADQLSEVTVTAERVSESAERTPVSIVTYTPEQILREGIRDVQTLAETDPSLQFTTQGGHPALTVRGVSTSNTTEVGNPSVPLVIDDFTVNRSDALDNAVFDLAQVEVLRGPQGTLFGRSASGGLVIMTTAAPTMQDQSSVSLEYGNYGALNSDAMVNIPVNDRLQVRVALTAHKHLPYRLDTTLGPNVPIPPAQPGKIPNGGDDQDIKAGRVELAFEPSSAFHGLLIYQYQDMNQAGPAIEAITFQNVDATDPNTDIYHTRPPTLSNGHQFPMYGPQWWKTQDSTAKLHLYYDLPANLTLSYLGGIDHYNHNEMASGDPQWPDAQIPALGPYTINTFFQSFHPTTQNHELRINSDTNARFFFQAGLYYFLEQTALADENFANAGSILASNNIAFAYWVHTESRAAYGQASFSVTPTSKISAGARYSRDTVQRAGYVAFAGPGPFQVNAVDSSKATWHLGYDWTPTPTNLDYIKADTGYKPGGFSNCGGVQVNFLPETVTSIEAGTKNQLASNHLQINADAFYEDYADQQVGLQGAPGCLHNIEVTNAGKSLIYGVEGDLAALAPAVGRADLAVSYLHARYQTFYAPPEIGAPALGLTNAPPDCKPAAYGAVDGVPQNCDLHGNTLPQAPTITVNLGLEHTWTMATDSTLTFRIEGHYSSQQWLTPFNFQDEVQPAYTVGNAFLTYTHKNWQVVLWTRNFTNKSYLNYASENGGGWDYLYSWGDPRTYGIRIQDTLLGGS